MHASSSELGNVDLAVVDQSGDHLGALTVDSAAERDASSEDLLDGASGLNSHTLGAELLGNINDGLRDDGLPSNISRISPKGFRPVVKARLQLFFYWDVAWLIPLVIDSILVDSII